MAKGHVKTCSTLLIVGEVQTISTLGYHPTLVRGPTSEHLQITNAGEGVEKKESFYTVGGNVNWYSHSGEQYEDFS